MAVVPSPNHHAVRAIGRRMHAPRGRGGGLGVVAVEPFGAQAKRIALRRVFQNGTEPDGRRSPHCDPQRTREHRDDPLCDPDQPM
ncbi:MAG: hypothetical protein QM570_05960 [Planctomycetota bacterium]|nr:hypothetical protein [Planctomycetota bacterium]